MAAPMSMHILKTKIYSHSTCVLRCYARRVNRSIQSVLTHNEDVKHLQSNVDPRKNAYLPYVPSDPVQRSLKDASSGAANIEGTEKTKQRAKHSQLNSSEEKDVKTAKFRLEIKQEKVMTANSPHKEKLKDHKLQKVDIKFEKLDETDKRFGRLIMRARSKKDRLEHKEIVLEGRNLIIDALKAGAKLKILYFSGSDSLEDFPTSMHGDTMVYKVQYKHLKLWSEVDTPQGLLGIFEMPSAGQALQPAAHPLPLTLICDSVRDAGNLGTLIRTAAAVGCQKIIATKGCVDVWSGKVLRSAAGSHFRVPILNNVTWPQVPGLLHSPDAIKVFLADNNTPTDVLQDQLRGSLEAVDKIDRLKDQEEQSDIESEAEEDTDEEDGSHDTRLSKRHEQKKLSKGNQYEEDSSYKDVKVLSAYRGAPLSVQVYDSVDYTDKHAVLVISGETSGVSLPARKLAYDNYGECVTIPMEGEVESLNCAVAGSVIMFEIAKQHRQRRNNI